jgi:hypothetical protein
VSRQVVRRREGGVAGLNSLEARASSPIEL